MDNRKRPLQEYFNAARSGPGISEEEVRTIVRGGERRGIAEPSRITPGRAAGLGGVLLAAALGAAALFQTEPAPHHTAVPARTEVRAGSPALPAAPDRPGSAGVATGEVRQSSLSGASRNETTVSSKQTIHSSNDQETHAMMTRKATSRLAAASIALMGTATLSATAQTTEHIRREKEMPPVIQEMQMELGTAVSDYWTSRLNDYKLRIDRALSPEDLAELNRMRVRFNVLAVEWLSQEMNDKNADTREDRKQGLERLIEIYKAAQTMARSYRPDLDGLATTVVDDLGEFLPEMNQRADNFVAARKSDIDRTGHAATIARARTKTEEFATMLRSGQGKTAVRMVYTFTLEPIVMLYDGTDLKTLWRQVEQISSGGAKTLSLPTDAIAGYKLPDNSLLKPNTPNPASSVATIAYTLPEPSEATILRLYDAQGSLVGTYDEGARESGDHAVQVDVSGFPAGTYLYHLTVRTPKGDRVYSRTMQVVR